MPLSLSLSLLLSFVLNDQQRVTLLENGCFLSHKNNEERKKDARTKLAIEVKMIRVVDYL